MGWRQRWPVPFDKGLDRSSGQLVVDPSSTVDLRDMRPVESGVQVRPGIGASLDTLPGPICHMAYFEAIAKLVLVVYTESSQDVDLYVADLNGHGATLADNWGTLTAGAFEPPRFSAAESYGILVLSHDDPNVAKRLDTIAFDGSTASVIQADLDGTGAKDTIFRGVQEYLGYAWYWGFGADNDKSRPEVLRPSRASDPTVIDRSLAFTVGARDNPILAARPCAGGLLLMKADQSFLLVGADYQTFGVVPVDRTTGVVSMRAAITVGGYVYAWSARGPRRTSDGFFEPLEFPLDLQAKLPAGLPSNTALQLCHTLYDADDELIQWYFPDPVNDETLIFALSLRGGVMRWSFEHLPKAVLSACVVAPSAESSAVEPGYTDPLSHSGVQTGSTFTTKVTVTHNDYIGDETIEIWGRQSTDPYVLRATAPINTSAATQDITITLPASGSWDLAVRYLRMGQPRADHASTDPTSWPSAALATGTITALPALTPNAPTFNAASTVAGATWDASWSSVVTGAAADILVTASRGNDGATVYAGQLWGTGAANATSKTGMVAGAQLSGLTVQIAVLQRLTVNGIAGYSPTSSLGSATFFGLAEQPSALTLSSGSYRVTTPPGTSVVAGWAESASVASATAGSTEVYVGVANVYAQSVTTPGVALGTTAIVVASPAITSCAVRGIGSTVQWLGLAVRHRLTVSGLEQFTRWATSSLVESGVCSL